MSAIKATVYLKSGGDVSTTSHHLSIDFLQSMYLRSIEERTPIIHEEANGESVQIIPADNVACVDLREVSE